MDSNKLAIIILAIVALALLLVVIGSAAQTSEILVTQSARIRWWGWTLAIWLFASFVIVLLVEAGLTIIALVLLAIPLLVIIIGNILALVRRK